MFLFRLISRIVSLYFENNMFSAEFWILAKISCEKSTKQPEELVVFSSSYIENQFVGHKSRRFYFRIRCWAILPTVAIFWATLCVLMALKRCFQLHKYKRNCASHKMKYWPKRMRRKAKDTHTQTYRSHARFINTKKAKKKIKRNKRRPKTCLPFNSVTE